MADRTNTTRRLAVLLSAAILLTSAAATAVAQQKNDPRALAIAKNFEEKLNLEGLDITNTFNLVQKKPGEADRVLQIKVYRRDSANVFTLIFQYPPSEKGKGYYRNGDDLYLYLPTTREFVYRNRKDDVGSTDVRTDTFGRLDLEQQYWITSAGQEQVAKWTTDVIKLDARQLDVSFPIQKWYVRKSDGLPVKVENFSASGTLLRTIYYVDYSEVAPGKYLFTKLLAIDNLQPGQKTYITNENISTDPIPDYVFSKAYLEQVSR
ncbi:outer membrane lipoprotein-sorting protein [Salinispira pacifica]